MVAPDSKRVDVVDRAVGLRGECVRRMKMPVVRDEAKEACEREQARAMP